MTIFSGRDGFRTNYHLRMRDGWPNTLLDRGIKVIFGRIPSEEMVETTKAKGIDDEFPFLDQPLAIDFDVSNGRGPISGSDLILESGPDSLSPSTCLAGNLWVELEAGVDLKPLTIAGPSIGIPVDLVRSRDRRPTRPPEMTTFTVPDTSLILEIAIGEAVSRIEDELGFLREGEKGN